MLTLEAPVIKTTRVRAGHYQFLHEGFLIKVSSFNNEDGNGDMWEWSICDATAITVPGANMVPTTFHPPVRTIQEAGIMYHFTKRYAVQKAAEYCTEYKAHLEVMQLNDRYMRTCENDGTVWTPQF